MVSTGLLSGIAGASIAFMGIIIRHFLRRAEKKKKMRRALYSEIEACEIQVARNLLRGDGSHTFYRKVDFIPTDVYDSQTANIGLLKEDEIEAVVDYYSLAKTVRSEIHALDEIKESDETLPRAQFSADGSVDNDLDALKKRQKTALTTLEKNIFYQSRGS